MCAQVLGGTDIYLGNLGDPTWVAEMAVYDLSRVLMDALLVCVHPSTVITATDPVYTQVTRLCVIWNSKVWITAFPPPQSLLI